MKLVRFAPTFIATLLATLPVIVETSVAYAQDSAFLACARHSDRADRIACLEDALEAALSAQESSQDTSQVATPAPARDAPEVSRAATPPEPVVADSATSTTVEASTAEPEERSSLLDRIRAFGQDEEDVSLSTDASGSERLHDTITALEKRNQMWIVTLSSGQVWRQEYPRSLNLRVGDEISIYQEGLGDGYRMAATRLSGFIRVERTK